MINCICQFETLFLLVITVDFHQYVFDEHKKRIVVLFVF